MKTDDNQHKADTKTDTDETPTTDILKRLSAPRRRVDIDVDYYQAAIDDPANSEDRKRELIAIIGEIVVHFIDMGFEVHPVQQAQKARAHKKEPPKHINPTEKERQSDRRAERIDA